jgi:hypothetical protein
MFLERAIFIMVVISGFTYCCGKELHTVASPFAHAFFVLYDIVPVGQQLDVADGVAAGLVIPVYMVAVTFTATLAYVLCLDAETTELLQRQVKIFATALGVRLKFVVRFTHRVFFFALPTYAFETVTATFGRIGAGVDGAFFHPS